MKFDVGGVMPNWTWTLRFVADFETVVTIRFATESTKLWPTGIAASLKSPPVTGDFRNPSCTPR